YQFQLVAERGCPALASDAEIVTAPSPELLIQTDEVNTSLTKDGLSPLAALAPRGQGHGGVLLFADHDPLALHRRLPVEHTLLQTAADLLGGVLSTERLIEALGGTSRTLGAVTRLCTR